MNRRRATRQLVGTVIVALSLRCAELGLRIYGVGSSTLIPDADAESCGCWYCRERRAGVRPLDYDSLAAHDGLDRRRTW